MYQALCDEYGVEDFPAIRLFPDDDDDATSKLGQNVEEHSNLSPQTLASLLKVDTEAKGGHAFEDPAGDSEEEDQEDEVVGRELEDESEDEDRGPTDKVEDMVAKVPSDDEQETQDPEEEPPVDESQEEEPEESDDESSEDSTIEDGEEPPPNFERSKSNAIPMLPPMPGRRPNAGHAMARNGNNQTNRYSTAMATEKVRYERKRSGFGTGLRKHSIEDPFGQKVAMEDTTETMRQFTPGTVEFQDRNQALIDAIRAKMNRRDRNQAGSIQLKKDSLPFEKDVRKPTLVKKAVRHIPVVGRMAKMSAEEELILDTRLSLTVALETGVSMGLEDAESRNAMKKFLELLAISLPTEWAIHKMIYSLLTQYSYAGKNRDNFREVIKQHNIPRTGWSESCSSRRTPNGFSCGMWKLLHVATVGVAEQRGGKNLIESGMVAPSVRTFTPMEAADTIRDFIDHFFTCRPCRANFIENYDDCNKNRRCDRLAHYEDLDDVSVADWKELPLWLWEVHNEVSVRLVNERAQKENALKGGRKVVTTTDEVKAIRPNVESCILCFNEDGTWNEGQVFRYLERMYWPGSDVDPMHDKLLKFESDNSNGFGLLWILTLVVVWIVYSMTQSKSKSIQKSVLAAKQMVSLQKTRLGLKGTKLAEKE